MFGFGGSGSAGVAAGSRRGRRSVGLALALALALASALAVGSGPVRSAASARGEGAGVPAGVEALDGWIARRVSDLDAGAFAIALVDETGVVWSKGYGSLDRDRDRDRRDGGGGRPATGDSVFRPGSISKLATDLAAMRLVEAGKLDLDAPVSDVLPEFRPSNPFGTPITLRQLMSHRSGLVRESPEGSYFDADPPSLAETVASLNGTSLVYPPESRTKYSNAAIAVAGRMIERATGERFEDYVRREVFERLGMTRSDFALREDLARDLAEATMWTAHGTEFRAPVFTIGTAPAGNLYSTANDLGRFIHALTRGGGGVVAPETLESMWTPQFADKGTPARFGLGFILETFEGKRRVGHSGAVYGFATELAVLPDERLGVVAIAARDCANALTRRVADVALSALRASKGLRPPLTGADFRVSDPVPAERAEALSGHYTDGTRRIELRRVGSKLTAYREGADRFWELRAEPGSDALVIDGPLAEDGSIVPLDDAIVFEGRRLERYVPDRPADVPDRWRGLIGEYGWDHNVLYILERGGRLHALIEWFFLYPLTEESPNVFAFPDRGLYEGERLIFRRDAKGRATEVEAASVRFPRRTIDGEDGATFKVKAVRPVSELRAEALAARPPEPKPGSGSGSGASLRAPELVELVRLDPTIKLDVRYATENNFLSTAFYTEAAAFLQRPAAEALAAAHRDLARRGLGLLVHDAYRPWHVTRMFRDATPPEFHGFVADPAAGSRHNRGCAVDVGLYDRETGEAVECVAGYDEFSDRAAPDYPGGTSLQRWRRDRLRDAMAARGFAVNPSEWWHFDYRDWASYPVLNLTFEEIRAAGD